MTLRYSKRLLLLVVFNIIICGIFAIKPPNDDCSNPGIIEISQGGFGYGVFRSNCSDLKDATLQQGELFHQTLVNSGNDLKSVWYRFYIPTARGIRVELKQKGSNIPQDAAGFTVYYSQICPPSLDDVLPAKLTPLGKFGNSFNPCMLPGTYYIQVGGGLNANDSIYIELTVSAPSVTNNYDYASDALDMGILSDKKTVVTAILQ